MNKKIIKKGLIHLLATITMIIGIFMVIKFSSIALAPSLSGIAFILISINFILITTNKIL